jgi:hypothetical protein
LNYEFGIKNELSGHFKLEVFDARTNKLKRTMEFNNLILNNGLNLIGTRGGLRVIDRCVIGTGTTVPDVNQTALTSLSASTTGIQANAFVRNTTTLPYYVGGSATYRFTAGQLNGNYSEIGVGYLTTSLFSRALILDTGGNPTSITVLSDEFLDVTYTLRMYIPDNDVLTSVTITGVGSDIPLSIRPFAINDGFTNTSSVAPNTVGGWFNGYPHGGSNGMVGFGRIISNSFFQPNSFTSLQPQTTTSYNFSSSIGTVVGNTFTTANYVTDNYYVDTTVDSSLNSVNGTYSHILVGFTCSGAWQFLLDTPITKTSSQTLSLTFRTSWARRTI